LSQSFSTKQDASNFKVVIRLRPPLARECPHGKFEHFASIVQVSPDSKSCAIMEYLGAEIEERERTKDIDQNPHLAVWQTFSFDYVYGPDSTQEHVYNNTARPAV